MNDMQSWQGIGTDLAALKKQAAIEHERAHPHYFERYGSIPTAFIHTPMFPLTEPKSDLEAWSHRTYGGEIDLRRGFHMDDDGVKQYRWAYGGMPRYLLAAVMTQALRQEARGEDPRHIDLSETLYRFLKENSIPMSGQNRKSVALQLQTLFSSPLSFTRYKATSAGTRVQINNIQMAKKVDIWLPRTNAPMLSGLEPQLTLTDDMVSLIRAGSATPIRLDIYAKLIKSPLAMDILNWLNAVTYHLSNASDKNPASSYEWEELAAHFTHSFKRLRDFRAHFKNAVSKIKEYYPALKIDCDYPHPLIAGKTLVVVYRSELLIPKKTRKELGL